MTDTVKVLAQSNPAATTLTDIYTVPGATSTILSSIVVCNQSGSSKTFRISVAVAGAGDDPKHYLYYDTSINANDTLTATLGITLAASTVVRVYASTTDLSFSLFGVEMT